MQLLKKSIVSGEIALQKKQQIDEGIKIAGKVDSLRATLADLEHQHQQFAEQSRYQLESELKPLFDEIASTKREIERLREEKRILSIPLDSKWEEVNNKSKEIDSIANDLSDKIAVTNRVMAQMDEKKKELKDLLFRAKTRERELEKIIESEGNKEKEIYDRLIEITDRQEAIEVYFEEKNGELLSRESDIAVKERELQMARDTIDRENQDIINIKIQLEDQRATLEDLVKKYNK